MAQQTAVKEAVNASAVSSRTSRKRASLVTMARELRQNVTLRQIRPTALELSAEVIDNSATSSGKPGAYFLTPRADRVGCVAGLLGRGAGELGTTWGRRHGAR